MSQNAQIQNEFLARQETILKGYQDSLLSLNNDRQALTRLMLEQMRGKTMVGSGTITGDAPYGYNLANFAGTFLEQTGGAYAVRILDLQDAKELRVTWQGAIVFQAINTMAVALSMDRTPMLAPRFSMLGAPTAVNSSSIIELDMTYNGPNPISTLLAGASQDLVTGAFSGTIDTPMDGAGIATISPVNNIDAWASIDETIPVAGFKFSHLIFPCAAGDQFALGNSAPATYQLFA